MLAFLHRIFLSCNSVLLDNCRSFGQRLYFCPEHLCRSMSQETLQPVTQTLKARPHRLQLLPHRLFSK